MNIKKVDPNANTFRISHLHNADQKKKVTRLLSCLTLLCFFVTVFCPSKLQHSSRASLWTLVHAVQLSLIYHWLQWNFPIKDNKEDSFLANKILILGKILNTKYRDVVSISQ